MRIPALLILASLVAVTIPANAASSFTFTTTPVTLNSSGNGTSTLTISALNGYTGQVGLRFVFGSGPAPENEAPVCELSGLTPEAITLTASTPKGVIDLPFAPAGSAVPGVVAHASPTPAHSPFAPAPFPISATALAGIFLLGAARIRRLRGSLALAALVCLSLTTLTGCGGHKTAGMTPGTYTYIFTASDADGHSATSTISVTVPAN